MRGGRLRSGCGTMGENSVNDMLFDAWAELEQSEQDLAAYLEWCAEFDEANAELSMIGEQDVA